MPVHTHAATDIVLISHSDSSRFIYGHPTLPTPPIAFLSSTIQKNLTAYRTSSFTPPLGKVKNKICTRAKWPKLTAPYSIFAPIPMNLQQNVTRSVCTERLRRVRRRKQQRRTEGNLKEQRHALRIFLSRFNLNF